MMGDNLKNLIEVNIHSSLHVLRNQFRKEVKLYDNNARLLYCKEYRFSLYRYEVFKSNRFVVTIRTYSDEIPFTVSMGLLLKFPITKHLFIYDKENKQCWSSFDKEDTDKMLELHCGCHINEN